MGLITINSSSGAPMAPPTGFPYRPPTSCPYGPPTGPPTGPHNGPPRSRAPWELTFMHLGPFSIVFSFHITVYLSRGAPNAPTRFPRALSKKLKRWTGAPVFNK